MDSASVEYVEPRIPTPDSAVLADAKASQRRYTASISSITRGIASEADPFPSSLWVAVGDSLPVSVHESRCQYNSRIGGTLTLDDSLWVLDDTSLAGLRGIARSPDVIVFGSPSIQLVGRRPGRTTLRITLPPQGSDSAPSRSPPERLLTRDIVVTRPLMRIELLPRPQSLHVDETIQLRVRAIDDQGRTYENPPARVTVHGSKQRYFQVATSPVNVRLDSVGTRTVVARFGSLADTLTLRIVPAPREHSSVPRLRLDQFHVASGNLRERRQIADVGRQDLVAIDGQQHKSSVVEDERHATPRVLRVVTLVAGGLPANRRTASCGHRWAPAKWPAMSADHSHKSFISQRYMESGRPDSNRRRPAWEAGILPTELRPRCRPLPTHGIYSRRCSDGYGRRTGGCGAISGAENVTLTPPFPSQRCSDGVPVRNVPSLHRIVAPAGGAASAAAIRCAGVTTEATTGVGTGRASGVGSGGPATTVGAA